MEDEYLLDGEVYSYDDIKLLADDEDVSVEDYVEGNSIEVKKPKTNAGDQYSDPSTKNKKYTEVEVSTPRNYIVTPSGQTVFEDEYTVNFAGKKIPKTSRTYPSKFSDYAKAFDGVEIQVLQGDALKDYEEQKAIEFEFSKDKYEQKDGFNPAIEADKLINGQSLITKDTKVGQKSIANFYFKMDDFEGTRPKVNRKDENDMWQNEYLNTEEEDLKNYFKSEKYGDKKYDEYKKYLETGELDLESEILINSGAIEQGENDAKDFYTQKYFQELNDVKKQNEIAAFLPDIFGNKTNLREYAKRNKDSIDFENKFGRPLLVTETIQGRTYEPNYRLDNTPTGFKDELKPQEKYLNEMYSGIKSDYKKLNDRFVSWERNIQPFQDKLNQYEKELIDLGEVNSGSSPEKIQQYNSIVRKVNEVQDQILDGGFDKIRLGLVKDQELADKKRDNLMKMAGKYNDLAIATNAAKLNYSNFDRAVLQIEKAFFGGGAMLGTGILKGLAYITEGVQSVAEQSDEDVINVQRKREGKKPINIEYDNVVMDGANYLYEQAIDYNVRLEENLNQNFARKFKFDDDVSWGTYISQTLADNSPSILAVMVPMGGGSLLTRSALGQLSKQAIKDGAGKLVTQQIQQAATRLTMGSMFTMSAGGSLANYEISARNASEVIRMNRALLANADTEDKKLEYKRNIANAEAAQDANFFQKAMSATTHGVIEMYAEKLGTLRYLKNAKMVRAVSNMPNPIYRFAHRSLLNTWGVGKQLGKGVGVEWIEETFTQFGQNASDIVIMGEDKSIAEGMDADFFASTAITSLALQSGNTASNIYNIVANETQSAYDILQNRNLLNQLVDVQYELQNTNISRKRKQELITKRKKILRKSGLNGIRSIQKLNNLTFQEKKTLFEAARLRRQTARDIYQARMDGASQTEIDGLLDKFNQHEKTRNDLAGKSYRDNMFKINKIRKAQGLESITEGQRADIKALNDLYTDVAALGQARNGKDFVLFQDAGKTYEDMTSKEKSNMIRSYIGKYGAKATRDIINAYKEGTSAVNVDGNIIVFQDNIDMQIATGTYTDAQVAAVAPMHELLHTELKKIGLIKDGKISEHAVNGVRELFSTIEQSGKLNDEQLKTFRDRAKAYIAKNKGVMDYEETITLINDMISIGALNEARFAKMYDLKSFLNSLVNKFQKGAGNFYAFDSGQDVYRYVTRFQQKGKEGDLKGGKEEKESEREVKSSLNVNDIYAEQGIAGYEQILKAKRPYAISLANKYRNRPKFAEYKDILIDEILTGKRGMLELIIGYDDYVQKQGKEGKEIAPLDAYINNAMSPKGLNRVKEIADRILGKDEQSQFTTSLDSETTFVQVQDFSDVTGSIPQASQEQTGQLRKLLKIGTDSKIYNDVLKDVENALQKDLPSIQKDPVKFRQALEKAYVKAFDKVIGTLIGTQKSPKFKKFITENKDIVQKLVAHKYKKRFGFMSTSAGRMTAEESRQSQTALGGSFVTDDYAGNQKYDLVELSDQDMLDNFVAGRETQYKSLRKSLAAELGLDATFDAMLRDERDHNKLKGFVGKMSEALKRDPSVKFSLNLNKLSPSALKDFHANKTEFLEALAQGSTFDASGVKKAFNKVFNKEDHPDLYAGREGVLKDFTKYMKPFTKVNPLLKQKPLKVEIESVFERSMQDIDQSQDLKYIFKLDKSVGSMFDTANDIESFHRFNKKLVEDMVEKYGIKNAMNFLINFHMPSIKNSGKIGSGVFQWDLKTKTVVKGPGSGRQGYNLYGTNEQLFEMLDLQQYGVTIEGKSNQFFLNGEKIKTTAPGQSTKGIQEVIDDNVDMPARKKHVKEVRKFLKFQMQWATDMVNDKSTSFTKNDFAMMMQGLSSNMNTALRAAALLKYSHIIPGKPASFYEYEHMTPARVVSLFLLEHYYNGNKSVDVDKVFDDYYVAVVPEGMNDAIGLFYKQSMPEGWRPGDNILKRYYNNFTVGRESYAMRDIESGKEYGKYHANVWQDVVDKKVSDPKDLQTLENIIVAASINLNGPRKGISVFDFDDTLAQSNSKVGVTMPDGSTRKINATEFALESADLEAAGAKFDFSEFSKVIDGKKGPLADLALKRQNKFGSGDIYVLTARPQEAAYAIHAFLKGVGLNIPIDNITGLENGTPESKADWMIGKVTEGYNDFYFADDAIKNVKAVKQVLEQFDVKSDVQQAIVKSSLNLDKDFNKIIEQNKGVKADAKYSNIVAKRMGANKGKYQFYLPSNAEDFKGLIYAMLGSGKKGNEQFAWFKQNLIDPYTRGIGAMNIAKTEVKSTWLTLLKSHPEVKKKLGKMIPGSVFTHDHAARVYIWTKNGLKIPGLSKRDAAQLNKIVEKDENLLNFINDLESTRILNKNGYPKPDDFWDAGSILSELNGLADIAGRKFYIKQWIDNKNQIFTKDNLNKIEANFGTDFRESLEDILFRMENGTNRNFGKNKTVNNFMDWINNSVGAVMFINMRSAVLQTLSTVNFINWGDNNIMAAGLAFANQPQYWKDWSMIWNSPKLLARRRGLQINVQEQELANAANKGGPKAVLSYLLKIGFTPTQLADSFAIATGGASFFRNRTKTYMKQGLDKAEAEKRAFDDFSDIAEETQQSGDPMLISPLQAGSLGRLLFSWQNTPFQYNRLIKRAGQDLINRRKTAGQSQFQSDITNVSKILYYGAIQNFIFSALQSALFAMLPGFSGDEDEDKKKQDLKDAKKIDRIANNMVDTILRGSGLPGAIVSTVKNLIREYAAQEEKGFMADHTYTLIQAINLSPPIGSKARKLYSAIQTKRFERDVIAERGFAIDSPMWQVLGASVSASLNIPLDNAVNIVNRISEAMDERNQTWQRVALALGWNAWDVGAKDEEGEEIKSIAKEKRKKEGIEKAKKTRKENKRLKEEAERLENERILKERIEKYKKDQLKIEQNK